MGWYTFKEYQDAESTAKSRGSLAFHPKGSTLYDRIVKAEGVIIDMGNGMDRAEANAKWDVIVMKDDNSGLGKVVGGALSGFLVGGPVGAVVGAVGAGVAQGVKESQDKKAATAAAASVTNTVKLAQAAQAEQKKIAATQAALTAQTKQASASPILALTQNPWIVGGILIVFGIITFFIVKK